MTTRIKAEEFFRNEMGPMTFGTFLVGVRHSMNISQADLARKLKVSRSMICDIEKGRVLVSPALAMKIARIGKFPEDMAIKYCLEDQLRKAKIKMKVNVGAA
jgi:DNA-binding XRE family transcriptional regulator